MLKRIQESKGLGFLVVRVGSSLDNGLSFWQLLAELETVLALTKFGTSYKSAILASTRSLDRGSR